MTLRRLWSFGVVLTLSAGCAPGGVNSAMPTTPSSLSGSGAVLAIGPPSSSYDASGPWHVVFMQGPSGPILGEFDVVLSQDSRGNLTFYDDINALFTFTRRGPGIGRFISYGFSAHKDVELPNSPCEMNLTGTAQLDTQTDTITVSRLSGIEDDCEAISGTAILTRN